MTSKTTEYQAAVAMLQAIKSNDHAGVHAANQQREAARGN